MGLVSAAIVTVTVSSGVIYGQGASDSQEAQAGSGEADGDVILPSPTPMGAVMAPPQTPNIEDGFRMEGSAEIDVVFADSDQLKQRIDRFYAAIETMEEIRRTYFGSLRVALEVMGYTGVGKPPARRRVCPEGVAEPYRTAYRAGRRYRELGREIERDFSVIRQLDRRGESAGLTPDYRWKVNRVPHEYRGRRFDYRDMRLSMLRQISPELRVRRCTHERLMAGRDSEPSPSQRSRPEARPDASAAQAAAQAPAGDPDSGSAAGDAASGAPPDEQADEGESAANTAPVTFFVDNQSCPVEFELVVSGETLGVVPAEQRVAFQAPAGRRSLCLLALGGDEISNGDTSDAGSQGDAAPPTASASPAISTPRPRCGDPGTLRSAYIHDGWALVTHCQ